MERACHPASIVRWHRRCRARARLCIIGATALTVCSVAARAQSLEQRLDADRYLRGLHDLKLPEVLEHYLEQRPATDSLERDLQTLARRHVSLSSIADTTLRRIEVESLLAFRGRIIAEHPTDPRRATWLADQAADLYYELLAIDGLHLAALFGLPDRAAAELVRDAAARMNDAAAEAESAVDAAIRALESSPNYARDILQQQRRRYLSDVERDRRIPFLRGLGAYLHGELNLEIEQQRSAAFEIAAQSLGRLTEALEGSAGLSCRLFYGYALARLGKHELAESEFRTVATHSSALPADIFAARMGGVLNRLAEHGPPSALEGLSSIEGRYRDPQLLFYRVLIADQRFRLFRMQAEDASPSERDRLYGAAFSSYTELMRLDYPPGTVPRDTLRAVVFARLTTASTFVDVPIDGLPSIVRIAQADARSRDPSTRDAAVITLETLLASSTLTAEDRAAALFSLGRALVELGQPLMAASRFLELAREHAADSQADRSIELAATLAWEESRTTPGESEARQLLAESVLVLLTKYPNLPSVDRWQYVAGRLALDDGRFNEAEAHFAKVTPDAPQWSDAHFMLVAVARQKALASQDDSDARPKHEATLQVIERVRPIIEQQAAAINDSARRASLDYYLAMLQVYHAEATLELGEPQRALDALANIERDQSIDSEALGQALRVRMNAYQTLQPPQPESALRDLQRFVLALPEQAGEVLQPMIASLSEDVRDLLERGQDRAAQELASGILLPAARTLDEWLHSTHAPDELAERSHMSLQVAEALRLAGRHEDALTQFRLLSKQHETAEALLGTAECLYALGGEQRFAEAMGIFKRLAAAGPRAGHEAYWLSQLRMLQILDVTGRNTNQIIPRIERLRQSDPDFGGERFRQGFEALRSRHGGRTD